MKQLIFILCAIIGVSQAQTIQYIGAPTTTVISRGNFRTDSIFYLPKRSKAPTDTAALRYQISDSSLYAWTGSQWRKVGADADTLVYSTRAWRQKGDDSLAARINLKVNISDTSSMLGNYIRHAGYGLTKSGQSFLVDTLNIATRAWRQKGLDSLAALEVSGSGTTNYVPKFTAGSTIGNSQIFDDGTSVGIGTTTLTSDKLIINGFAYTRSGYKITNDTIDFRISHALGNRAYVGNVNAYPLSIFTDNTERIRILSTGAVGINTTTPASQLTTLGVIEGTNGSIRTVISYTGTGGVVGTLTNHPLELYANGALRGSISVSGEFLLNTSSTDAGDYKLQVDGNIYNTGSITTGAPSGGSIKPWKIGEAATVSPTSPNRTLRVEVDGVVYYIHAKTTND